LPEKSPIIVFICTAAIFINKPLLQKIYYKVKNHNTIINTGILL